MRVRFTKMQGAGNDFVMLDATRTPLDLSAEQFRALADRHFGIGADQILVVEPPRTPGVDFGYRIFNASGALLKTAQSIDRSSPLAVAATRGCSVAIIAG